MRELGDIVARVRSHGAELRDGLRVSKLGVFGSFADARQTEDSDVDCLVEFEGLLGGHPRAGGVPAARLGREVDVATEERLRWEIRADIHGRSSVCGRHATFLYVNDMVEAAERILAVCAGIPAEQILDDVDRADIVLWRLTVLGEAAKKRFPDSSRRAPRGRDASRRTRGPHVHHYEGLDPDRIAEVVGSDIPRLLGSLRPLPGRGYSEDWRRREEELGEPGGW